MPSPLLQVTQLTKTFGTVTALAGVSFALQPGEILGVVGQRSAGKSTLLQVLSGMETPTTGEVFWAGQPRQLNPQQAQRLGIATVHQQPRLAGNLDVVSNMFLGREQCTWPRWGLGLKQKEMLQAARTFLAAFDMPPALALEPTARLSSEQQQVVALARALNQRALTQPLQLLILDDTLAGLSYARQLTLLDRIQALAAQQVAVIISSDDLKHLFAVTHRLLVLYQGRPAALCRTAETTPREIVSLIVGSRHQDQVTPVIWAFENYHAAQQQAEELRRTQFALRQSLAEQDSINRQLIERLHDQVEALDRLNLALQEAHRRLMTEREAERKALARELHDQIIQDLLGYLYQLDATTTESLPDAQQVELAKIHLGLRQVVGSLRQMCSDLRPPTIDHHGLPAAIRSLAHQWAEQSGIPVALEIDPALGRLPEPIELSVFRIVQEGLSNVRKHAYATNVNLSLQRTAHASLAMRLADNGRGMLAPPNLATLSAQKHFGLVGISERVSLLGGTLQVNAPTAGGVELEIEIPSPYPSINSTMV